MTTARWKPLDVPAESHQAGNGEMFWSPGAVMSAIERIAARNLGIVGGEIYERVSGGAWATFVSAWQTEPPWSSEEAWHSFVRRSTAQARDRVQSDGAAAGARLDRRLYFLAVREEGA